MSAREARLPAFAKLNLDLRVLYRRPDGYHELRSIFQTISLADQLSIRFERARRTAISTAGNLDIPGNLIVRAAQLCLDELRITGAVHLHLQKRIPMGAGLGGGSSDAAAVLRALPALTGKPLPFERRLALAAQLGSDVPFFLCGGTAAVLGRGEEVYPLRDLRAPHVLLVTPGVHVSTKDAYAALTQTLTTDSAAAKIAAFQELLWTQSLSQSHNDFEPPVFQQHPELKKIKRTLQQAGANPALMTGSGASLFGIFPGAKELAQAKALFPHGHAQAVKFITRRQYEVPY